MEKLTLAVLLCSATLAFAGGHGDDAGYEKGGEWMSKMMQNFMAKKPDGGGYGGTTENSGEWILKFVEMLLKMTGEVGGEGGTWKFALPAMSGEFSYGWDDDENGKYHGDGLALPKSHWKLDSKGEVPDMWGGSKGDYKWTLGAAGGNSGGKLDDEGKFTDLGKGWGEWKWNGGYTSDSGGWGGHEDGQGVMRKMMEYMMDRRD